MSAARVVARWFPVLGYWSILHAASLAPAFRAAVNRFGSREAAEAFARSHGCIVEGQP